MGLKHIKYKFIDNSSKYYRQMTELRYKAFYQDLGLGRELISDSLENDSLHLIALSGERVIGCGRLSFDHEGAQITQMAVEESMRKSGVGSSIMARLLHKAEEMGAERLYLAARVEAEGFYRKFGFCLVGGPFPSQKTGLPHVKMEKQLKLKVG